MDILFQNVAVLGEDFTVLNNAYVGVRGEKICYLSVAPPADIADYGSIYDGRHKFMVPGFYNTHTHLAMSLLRGYGENMVLQDWLAQRIFPFEAKLTTEAVYWGTMLGVAEALRFGTVAATDMYYDAAANCQVATETGFKLNASLMAPVTVPDNPQNEFPFAGAEALLEQYHPSKNGRVRLTAYIHAEYTTDPVHVAKVAEFAKAHDLRMHLHLSETKLEHEECKQRHNGMTPAAYFNSLGAFDVPATAAHCTWAEPEDIAILKEKGVTVAHNPVSNLKLASGICPAPAMLRAGVNVSLGTDSVASNNDLNLLEELKLFAMLHKANSGDPTVITTKEAAFAGTMAGAISQGRGGCGALAVGNQADLVLLDTDQPHWYPQHDLLNQLIFAAQGSDVTMTMADGNILYQDGEYMTLDVEKTYFEVERQKDLILSQLG